MMKKHILNNNVMQEKQQYIPINLNILRIDILKPFDIYIKTENGREQYVLYSKEGLYFTNKIKQNLLRNNVNTIYISDNNRDLYQEYVEDNLQFIINDKDINPVQKSRIVYESGKHLMEKLFDNPRSDMLFRTKKTVNNIVRLILSDRETTNNLIRIREFDNYTYTHSVNVGIFSVIFAREMLRGISEQVFYELGLGFFLHDIGKSRIPLEIINKKGLLDKKEWNIMKKHPEMGYQLLEESGFIQKESAIIVLQHHERIDGSGYPKGLRGGEINIFGRICSLADTFDAMTTNRSYQKVYSAFEACDIIKNKMIQKEFDRDVFSKFIQLVTAQDT
jgi:HD-GYP domain-containing protein (c-di-GMP phosphodiesterase class II)